jgi:hypothetical protein
MYLPGPVRRRLSARDERVRARGVAEGRRIERSRRAEVRHRYVFVVSYGRSGSTLVQGLLNTLPRTLVRGENGLYLVDLHRAHAAVAAVRADHDKHVRPTPESAFFGLKELRPALFARSVRELVTAGILGRTDADGWDTIGFKEVAWHRVEPDETAAFFDFLDRAFPDVRYVLNTRDHDAVVASGFWKRVETDTARRLIERVTEVQEHLRATRPDRVVEARYEEITGSDGAVRDAQLRALGAFVTGSPVDEEVLTALRATLARPHGPNPSRREPV